MDLPGLRLGVGSGSEHEYLVEWQKYRSGVLGEPLLDQIDFKGKSLLDLACNCGYWALPATERGLLRYQGVEGRQVFIDQGNYLWANVEIDYDFMLGNVVADATWDRISLPVDIAFCVGILYHLPDWKSCLRRVMEATKETIVIETRINVGDVSRPYPGDLKFNRISDVGIEAVQPPSFSLLIDTLEQAGWNWKILQNDLIPDPCIARSEQYGDTLTGRIAILAEKSR